MYLYHGTSTKWLGGIQQHGLLADTEISNWPEYPSLDGRTYLTTAYAIHFAQGSVHHHGGKAMILRIDSEKLDQKLFCADEDYLAQNMIGNKFRLREAHRVVCKLRELWEDQISLAWESLARLGTIAYRGTIPVEAIDRIAIVETLNSSVLLSMSDPQISLTNYAILGSDYEQDLTWFMGGALGAKPLPSYLKAETSNPALNKYRETEIQKMNKLGELIRAGVGHYDSFENVQTFAQEE